MSLSPLQLNSFRLIHVRVDAHKNYRGDKNREADYTIETEFDVLKAKNKMLFRVPLSFHICAKTGNSHCNIKRLDINVEGIFVLPEDLPEDMVQKLVPYNCLAILYSLSRGLILGITGTVPGGAFLLPTLDFTSIIREKIRQESEKEIKNNTARKGRAARHRALR